MKRPLFFVLSVCLFSGCVTDDRKGLPHRLGRSDDLNRYVDSEVRLVGTFHEVEKGVDYFDAGFAKLESVDESFYREINGRLEAILKPGERVEVVARLRHYSGMREALEEHEKKVPVQEVPSTHVETIGGKQFVVWPPYFYIVDVKVVPLRYPLTNAEVQMVRERLAVAPENPRRIALENAPLIAAFGTMDFCHEGDYWYSENDEWTQLNKNWALLDRQQIGGAGTRYFGELVRISDVPKMAILPPDARYDSPFDDRRVPAFPASPVTIR